MVSCKWGRRVLLTALVGLAIIALAEKSSGLFFGEGDEGRCLARVDLWMFSMLCCFHGYACSFCYSDRRMGVPNYSSKAQLFKYMDIAIKYGYLGYTKT